MLQAFTTFEEHWRELCNDIKSGTLSSRIKSPKLRDAILEIINSISGPNTNLASKLQGYCEELEKVDWFGLIPKIWPNAKYMYSIMTGSMIPYLKKLRHYGNGLPMISADYGSTESWIGVNVDPSFDPERVTFAVVPTFSYFEFIPLHRNKQDSTDDFIEDTPIPLSKVIVGQHYEIVLTTFTGTVILSPFIHLFLSIHEITFNYFNNCDDFISTSEGGSAYFLKTLHYFIQNYHKYCLTNIFEN